MMKTAILSLAILANLGFPLIYSKSHRFEDDFVERTLAVIVRGNKAEITYSLGLNKKTTEKILKKWSKLDPAPLTLGTLAPPSKTKTPANETDSERDSGHVLSPELTKRFHVAAGEIAPELDQGLAWLNTDSPVRLADLGGHVVLIDFWTY